MKEPPRKSKLGRNGRKQTVAPSNLVVAPVKFYMLSWEARKRPEEIWPSGRKQNNQIEKSGQKSAKNNGNLIGKMGNREKAVAAD